MNNLTVHPIPVQLDRVHVFSGDYIAAEFEFKPIHMLPGDTLKITINLRCPDAQED